MLRTQGVCVSFPATVSSGAMPRSGVAGPREQLSSIAGLALTLLLILQLPAPGQAHGLGSQAQQQRHRLPFPPRLVATCPRKILVPCALCSGKSLTLGMNAHFSRWDKAQGRAYVTDIDSLARDRDLPACRRARSVFTRSALMHSEGAEGAVMLGAAGAAGL